MQFEVWGHFLIWTKKKNFFLENCTLVLIWIFLDNYLSIRPENLKTSLKNLAKVKISTFAVSKWYTHFLTLNYPLQYANRLSNILQGKQQQLCIHLVHESLVGQCEYITQHKSSFWCHVIDTNGVVLLLIFINKFVLVFILI